MFKTIIEEEMADIERHETKYGDIVEYDDDKHEYRVDGEKLHGVTSSLGVINKPGLNYWRVAQAVGYIKDNLTPDTSDLERTRIFAEAPNAHRLDNTALNVGSRVHDWIEQYVELVLADKDVEAGKMAHRVQDFDVKEDDKSRQVQNSLLAFLAWEDDHDVEYIATEEIAYSKQYGYAGRADLVARVDGDFCLCDFKTSKGIYPSYYVQGSAYAKAFEEEGRQLRELVSYPFDRVAVLRLPKDGKPFEYGTRDDIDYLYDVFLAALTIKNWKSNG